MLCKCNNLKFGSVFVTFQFKNLVKFQIRNNLTNFVQYIYSTLIYQKIKYSEVFKINNIYLLMFK